MSAHRGPPVCRDNAEVRESVAKEFIEWATKEKKRRVAYCIVDTAFSEILGKELGWSVLSCVREDRLRESLSTTKIVRFYTLPFFPPAPAARTERAIRFVYRP